MAGDVADHTERRTEPGGGDAGDPRARGAHRPAQWRDDRAAALTQDPRAAGLSDRGRAVAAARAPVPDVLGPARRSARCFALEPVEAPPDHEWRRPRLPG